LTNTDLSEASGIFASPFCQPRAFLSLPFFVDGTTHEAPWRFPLLPCLLVTSLLSAPVLFIRLYSSLVPSFSYRPSCCVAEPVVCQFLSYPFLFLRRASSLSFDRGHFPFYSWCESLMLHRQFSPAGQHSIFLLFLVDGPQAIRILLVLFRDVSLRHFWVLCIVLFWFSNTGFLATSPARSHFLRLGVLACPIRSSRRTPDCFWPVPSSDAPE